MGYPSQGMMQQPQGFPQQQGGFFYPGFEYLGDISRMDKKERKKAKKTIKKALKKSGMKKHKVTFGAFDP